MLRKVDETSMGMTTQQAALAHDPEKYPELPEVSIATFRLVGSSDAGRFSCRLVLMQDGVLKEQVE